MSSPIQEDAESPAYEFKQFIHFQNPNESPFSATFNEFTNKRHTNPSELLHLRFELKQNPSVKKNFLKLVRENFEIMVEDYFLDYQLQDSEANESQISPHISFVLRIPNIERFHAQTKNKYKRNPQLVDLYEEIDKFNSRPIPRLNTSKITEVIKGLTKSNPLISKEISNLESSISHLDIKKKVKRFARNKIKEAERLGRKLSKKEIEEPEIDKLDTLEGKNILKDILDFTAMNTVIKEAVPENETNSLIIQGDSEIAPEEPLSFINKLKRFKDDSLNKIKSFFTSTQQKLILNTETQKQKDENNLKVRHYRNVLKSIFSNMDELTKLVYFDSILVYYDELSYQLDLHIARKLGKPIDELEEHELDKLAHFMLFIDFFSATITYFTNLKCKFYLDEAENMNVEFYLTEGVIKYMAGLTNYSLNYRIISESNISIEGTTPQIISKSKMIELNNAPRETYYDETLSKSKENLINAVPYYDDPMYHPPYEEFTNDDAYRNYYRRYDMQGNLHLCENCVELEDGEHNPKCNSSIFRDIDRSRIAIMEIEKLVDFTKLNDFYTKEDYNYAHILKKAIITHSYDSFNLDSKEIIDTCLSVEKSPQVDRMLSKFRNLCGEEMAFYFLWVSHFISSIFNPASLGLAVLIIGQIVQYTIGEESYLNEGYDLVLKLPFSLFGLIWAKSYMDSWKKVEEFYKYEWGMTDYCLENQSIKKDKYYKFLNVEMPYSKDEKRLFNLAVSWAITLLMLVFVILLNNGAFWLNEFIKHTFPGIINRLTLGPYMYPASLFVMRQVNTVIFLRVSEFLTQYEIHNTILDKRNSQVYKLIAFQFFNYYYNLYYIALFKTDASSCLKNNCKFELENQVTVILISAILNDMVSILYFSCFSSKSIKNKINQLKETTDSKSKSQSNASEKSNYYCRKLYEDSHCDREYIDVTLSFGYVIQFGGSNPVCFFLCLIQAMIARLNDALKIGVFEHTNFSSGSKGIGCHSTVISFMITMGIISNLLVNLVTDSRMNVLTKTAQYSLIMILENILFVLLMFMEIRKLPIWFNFKAQIKVSYLNFLKLTNNLK